MKIKPVCRNSIGIKSCSLSLSAESECPHFSVMVVVAETLVIRATGTDGY